MDPRPIGIFDSGLGGLTAARTLEELLPGETLIYFGDSANAPYGIRTREQLLALAGANTDFLLRFDVKAILVACGTVSSTVIGRVRERCAVPMFDVLEAACRGAAALGAKRVAVTATEATVKSGAFPRRLGELDGTMEVFSKACQSLVAAVEAGHFRRGGGAGPRPGLAAGAAAAGLHPLSPAGRCDLRLPGSGGPDPLREPGGRRRPEYVPAGAGPPRPP